MECGLWSVVCALWATLCALLRSVVRLTCGVCEFVLFDCASADWQAKFHVSSKPIDASTLEGATPGDTGKHERAAVDGFREINSTRVPGSTVDYGRSSAAPTVFRRWAPVCSVTETTTQRPLNHRRCAINDTHAKVCHEGPNRANPETNQ